MKDPADERLIAEARNVLRLLVRRGLEPGEAVDVLLCGLLGLHDGTLMPGNYDVAAWQAAIRQSVINLLAELQKGSALQ